MEAKKQFIKRNFERYKRMKQDDFFLKGNVRADAIMMKRGYLKKIKKQKLLYTNIPEGVNVSILAEDFIEKMSPNNIDSCYFWKKAIEVFPLASVAYSPGADTVEELNKRSLDSHIASGSIAQLEKVLKMKQHPKMLEIGPGYGCVTGFIAENYSIKNYYAIDVNPLFKFPKLYKTDGKTIPESVPNNLDVVYSVNVFQHLSPEQRQSYYEQIQRKLVVGGKFIFFMFVVDRENENMIFGEEKDGKRNIWRLFGTRDEKGNSYVNFFNQFTKCNRIEELEMIFKNLNMDFEVFEKSENRYFMVATKK